MTFPTCLRSVLLSATLCALAPLLPAQESAEIGSLRTKAERGNAIAQYNLGLAYAEGRGVSRDPQEAFVWLSLARENGARGRALDSIAATLDSTALAEAQQTLATRRIALGSRPGPTMAPKAAPVVPAPAEPVTATTPAAAPAANDFDQQVETTLNRVSEEKAALERQLAAARSENAQLAAEFAEAQKFAREVETTLNRVNEEKGALASQLARAAATAAELENARRFNQQVESTLNRVSEEKAALERQLAALQSQLDARPNTPPYPDLRDRVAELEQQVAAARETQSALQAARTEAQDAGMRATQLAGETRTLQQRLATLEEERATLQSQVQMLESERTALRRQIETDRENVARLATLSSESAEARAQLAAAVQARDEAAAALQALRADSADAQHRTARVSAENQALQQRVATLMAERDVLATEASQLRQRPSAPAYPDLRGRVAELERQLATRPAAPAYPDLRAQVGELEGQVALLREQLAGREAAPAYPDLRARVAELEGSLATLAERANAAQQERTELQARFEERNRTALAAERERTSLAAQVRMLESEKTSQRRQAEAATEETHQLRTQVAALRNDLDAARRASAPATPAYPDLRGRVGELESQLAAATAAGERAQADAAGAPQLRRERDELATRTEQLASEIASLRSDRERLQRLVADSGNQLRAASAETARVRAEADAATRAAQARVAELENARPAAPAYPDLSDRVRELEAELAAARTGAGEPTASSDAIARQLAQTEDKLATSLRGYALLQRERDALAEQARRSHEELTAERTALLARVASLTSEVAQLRTTTAEQAAAAQRAETLAAERENLAGQIATLTAELQSVRTASQGDAASAQAEIARLNESLAALQRSTSQTAVELASTRELLRQVQGSNVLLATENQRLKGALAGALSPIAGPPSAPAATPAPPRPPPDTPRTHTVVPGDSLSRISQRYYGTPNRWQDIYRLNQAQLRNADALQVGLVLTLP